MSDKLTVEEWGSHIFQAKAGNMRPLAEALYRLQETINNPTKQTNHFIIEGGTNDSDSGKTKWQLPEYPVFQPHLKSTD